MKHYNHLITLALVAAAAACTTTEPTPTLDTAGEATFDGLYAVENSRAEKAWARPDVDLTVYSKVMMAPPEIEYRPGGDSGRGFSARQTGGPYEITEEQKARFRELVFEEMTEEMSKSESFELVTEPGPDVLLVRAALLDVVSYVPPQTAGRNAILLNRIGEATVVLELRDSITETTLARAVARGVAEPRGPRGVQRSNRTLNVAEVRRVVSGWGETLRSQLETFMAES